MIGQTVSYVPWLPWKHNKLPLITQYRECCGFHCLWKPATTTWSLFPQPQSWHHRAPLSRNGFRPLQHEFLRSAIHQLSSLLENCRPAQAHIGTCHVLQPRHRLEAARANGWSGISGLTVRRTNCMTNRSGWSHQSLLQHLPWKLKGCILKSKISPKKTYSWHNPSSVNSKSILDSYDFASTAVRSHFHGFVVVSYCFLSTQAV